MDSSHPFNNLWFLSLHKVQNKHDEAKFQALCLKVLGFLLQPWSIMCTDLGIQQNSKQIKHNLQ